MMKHIYCSFPGEKELKKFEKCRIYFCKLEKVVETTYTRNTPQYSCSKMKLRETDSWKIKNSKNKVNKSR